MTNDTQDIVARLRSTGSMTHVEVWETLDEATDLIEEQAAEIERLKDQVKALQQKLPSYNPFLL